MQLVVRKKWRKRKTNVTIRSNNCLFRYHVSNELSNRSALFLLGGENFSFHCHLHEFHATKFDNIQKGTNPLRRTIQRIIFNAEINNKKISHFSCLFIFFFWLFLLLSSLLSLLFLLLLLNFTYSTLLCSINSLVGCKGEKIENLHAESSKI